MPVWPAGATSAPYITLFEVQFDFKLCSTVSGSYPFVVLMDDGTNTIMLQYNTGGGNFFFYQNGSGGSGSSATLTTPGTTWRIKVDCTYYLNEPYTNLASWNAYYSTNSGTTWNTLISGWQTLNTTMPSVIRSGVYFAGSACTATTGGHIGTIVVQDLPPATPNCQIQKAYIASSGQSAVFFFETLGGSAITPTAMTYAPSFFQNGNSIGVGINPWVNGTAPCLIVQFQNNVQLSATDTVTVSVPASWVAAGYGNAANQVTNLVLTNYTGKSCFGTDTLVKTFKPGFNISYYGTSSFQNIPANLRYRLPTMLYGANTVDGYPTSMYATYGTQDFYDWGSVSNGVDNTKYPGVPGYYALGYDETWYSGNPTTLTLTSPNTAQSTVTQIHSCDNPGTNGIGQFYLFQVTQTAGSTSANIPVQLYWQNANKAPNISNLLIVGPGDFTFTLGQPLSFDRTHPYALSNQFLAMLLHGCGVLRFMDSYLGLAGVSQATEVWEMHQLTDFSWNNANYVDTNIGITTIRGLYASTSPYIYGDVWTLPTAGSQWTAGSTLGANITALQTTISMRSAQTECNGNPLMYGLILTIDSEQMRVRTVAGTTVTVERGSSGTTATSHSAGATITLSSRWAWGSLNVFGGVNTQLIEVVTQNAHNCKLGQLLSYNGCGQQ